MTGSGARMPGAAAVVESALATSTADVGCVVIVEDATEVEARFANNTTTTNGHRRLRRVTVVSIRSSGGGGGGVGGGVGGGAVSVGVASRSGADDVADLVAAAEADAAESPPAEDAAPLVELSDAGSPSADFDAQARPTDISVLTPVLTRLRDRFDEARRLGHVLAGFASHRLATTYLGTSTGLRLRHEQPTGSLEVVARTPDGSRSAWAGAGTPWFDDVDLDAVHRRLERRLVWAERRVELPAGRYETVLPPDAVADLMVSLAEAMSGRDAEDGRSAFSAPGGGTKVGSVLASLPFVLRSDPAAPGIECAPFLAAAASSADVSVFDNGLPLARTNWIAGGRVEHLHYHRAGAARSGVETSPPVDNLVLEVPGSEGTLDDLVTATDRGLLLTCLWYIREVDPVTLLLTGLTRDGVYLVEGGEVVGAANNFRFNESPLGVLARTVEAGRTERALSREWNEWMNRTAMPALRVHDFNMTSVSPAN